MHFKRLLPVFVTLSAMLVFATSCENDRDPEDTDPQLEIANLANIYAKNTLIVNANKGGEDEKVGVVVNADGTATFTLNKLITGYPEIVFTTALEKKQNGMYSFDHSDNLITSEEGKSYNFKGSFVGSVEKGISMVVSYDEIEHMAEQAIYAHRVSPGSGGSFFHDNLFINGSIATNKVSSAAQPSVRLSMNATTKVKTAQFGYTFLGSANFSFANITVERDLVTPNIFRFVHFDETEEGLVNENNYRKIVVKEGIIDNLIAKVNVSLLTKTDLIGGTWKLDTKNKENISITLTSKAIEDKANDADYAEFLKENSEIALSILFRLSEIAFSDNGTAKASYLTKTGVKDLPKNLDYMPTSATAMKLGMSEEAMVAIAEANGLERADISAMVEAGEGRHRFSTITLGSTSDANTKLWTITTYSIRSFSKFAVERMPKNEADMKAMGYTMSKANIDKLLKVYQHMGDSGLTGKVTIGLNKK